MAGKPFAKADVQLVRLIEKQTIFLLGRKEERKWQDGAARAESARVLLFGHTR
jgi:hypothetical protein